MRAKSATPNEKRLAQMVKDGNDVSTYQRPPVSRAIACHRVPFAARFAAVLTEYKQAPEVTRARLYLETMSEVLPRAGRVLVVQDGQVGPLPLMDLNLMPREAKP